MPNIESQSESLDCLVWCWLPYAVWMGQDKKHIKEISDLGSWLVETKVKRKGTFRDVLMQDIQKRNDLVRYELAQFFFYLWVSFPKLRV